MTTWAEFRTKVRRTILKDTDAKSTKYSNDQILDSFLFSLQTFVEHTALASSVTITGATATQYTLPANLYDSLDQTGLVCLTSSTNVEYLNPVRHSSTLNFVKDRGFYTWGNDLILNFVPDDGSTLIINYFAYYTEPVADTDVLDIPAWAEPALAMLTGYYVLAASAVASGNISQWKEGSEKGQPENNALRVQGEWLYLQYERLINSHSRQERVNFYRSVDV